MISPYNKVKEICGGLRPLLLTLSKTESASQHTFSSFLLLGPGPVHVLGLEVPGASQAELPHKESRIFVE